MEKELEEDIECNLKLKKLYHKRNVEYNLIEKESESQWQMITK